MKLSEWVSAVLKECDLVGDDSNITVTMKGQDFARIAEAVQSAVDLHLVFDDDEEIAAVADLLREAKP